MALSFGRRLKAAAVTSHFNVPTRIQSSLHAADSKQRSSRKHSPHRTTPPGSRDDHGFCRIRFTTDPSITAAMPKILLPAMNPPLARGACSRHVAACLLPPGGQHLPASPQRQGCSA